MGYRLRLLEAGLRWAKGDPRAAQRLARKAHLCRESILVRWLLRFNPRVAGRLRPERAQRLGRFLLRLAPRQAWLRLDLAQAELQREGDAAWAWECLAGTPALAQDDPLLLEQLLMLALDHMQASRHRPLRLGHQEWSPQAPRLFEETLGLLRHRHGEARQAWDRTAPALHLLEKGRLLEAVTLAQTLPPARRGRELCELETMALRRLGDAQGAWASVETGLEVHPTSFRLWMERFHGALSLPNLPAARESLEMAERLLPPDMAHATVVEWRLHQAEFSLRVDHDAEAAWGLLEELPGVVRDKNAHLVARVLIDLERFEEAQAQVDRLLRLSPASPEAWMLQAECMAGLEAWNSLVAYLEDLPAVAQNHAAYWHLRGLGRAHLDDPHKARLDLERAAQLAPRDPRIVLDAGHACAELSDHDRAEQHWRQALRLTPDSEEALYQMACSRHAQHDMEGAKRFLRECLLHHPESESAQVFLAELEAN